MCTFSASTAACERGFSSMNRQKTKSRTLLNLSTQNDIMRICVDGPAIAEFDAAMHLACGKITVNDSLNLATSAQERGNEPKVTDID